MNTLDYKSRGENEIDFLLKTIHFLFFQTPQLFIKVFGNSKLSTRYWELERQNRNFKSGDACLQKSPTIF